MSLSLKKYTQEELVQSIQKKDQAAFSYLYDNYSNALYGVLFSIVQNNEDAEDLLQILFLKVWRSIEKYDSSKGRLYTWMLNIARNLAIDFTRSKSSKAASKIQNLADNVYNNSSNAEQPVEYAPDLSNLLNELKEDYKLVIDLVYLKGYTHEQAAKELNIPLGTLKTRVRQGLILLRELTKKEFFN